MRSLDCQMTSTSAGVVFLKKKNLGGSDASSGGVIVSARKEAVSIDMEMDEHEF